MRVKNFFCKLSAYSGGVVIVSHDCELLNQMDVLLELDMEKSQ